PGGRDRRHQRQRDGSADFGRCHLSDRSPDPRCHRHAARAGRPGGGDRPGGRYRRGRREGVGVSDSALGWIGVWLLVADVVAIATGPIRVEARHESFAQQAVDDAVARERSRIARELHDGVATDLAGAISLFKVYLERTKGQPDEILKEAFDILERSLKDVRE